MNRCIVLGVHEALTPLSIVAGAITLFESMEATLCLPYMMREMKHLTNGHPVAEGMLIFAFAYLVEGASGFGTPAALGAPMLISLGHQPVQSVVTLLVFNTVATVWGACGTPIWFGFGTLDDLTDDEFLQVSQKAAVALAIGSIIIIPWVMTVLLPWTIVKQNLLFISASLAATIGPSLGIAFFSFEFPSLLGGIIGLMLTGVLIKVGFGLKPLAPSEEQLLGRSVQDISTVAESTGIVHNYRKSTSAVSDLSVAVGPTTQSDKEIETDFHDAASQTEESLGSKRTANANVTVESMLEHRAEVSASADDANDSGNEMGRRSQKRVIVSHTSFVTEYEQHCDVSDASSHGAAVNMDNSVPPSLQEAIDRQLGPRKEWSDKGYMIEMLSRTFPIWGTVLLLIVTRVDQIGLKPLLLKRSPYLEIDLGAYGMFRLSVSVVFQLNNILTYPGLNWDYPLFYTPFILPFVVVSLVTFIVFRKNLQATPVDVARTVGGRLLGPAVALAGALVLVQLMIESGESSPAYIIGSNLADWFKQGFIVISPLLGALGSFFSGSTTVSNLTFGNVQQIAAEHIGTSVTAMLALQAVGASAGNAFCLNNIIAVSTVVGLNVGEGTIVGLTYKFVLSLTTIATVVMLGKYHLFLAVNVSTFRSLPLTQRDTLSRSILPVIYIRF
jgi:L-lactate permease